MLGTLSQGTGRQARVQDTSTNWFELTICLLSREGLVGNLLREYHRNLGSSFSLPAHRKPMAGLSLVKSGTDCKYSAFIPKIKFDTYDLSKNVYLHLLSLSQVCLLRRS